MGPEWLQITIGLLGSLVRLVGMVLFGLGAGWLTLEFMRKAGQTWQLQIALFLGFIGLAVAMAVFLTAAGLGGFGIGVGVAIFIWGLPKPTPKEGAEKPAKK